MSNHDIDYADVRGKLVRFYEKHAPEKVADVPKVLQLMQDTDMTEHQLFDTLCRKYKVLYDPLDWKAPVIGKGTINGAKVEQVGSVDEDDATAAPKFSAGMDTASGVAKPKPKTKSAASSKVTSKRRISSPTPNYLKSTAASNASAASRPRGMKPTSAKPAAQHYDAARHESPTARRQSVSQPREEEDEAFAERMTHRRKHLTEFYKQYNPQKLSDVDKIMELSTESTDEEIFERLCKKYNAPKKAVFKKVGIGAEASDAASSTAGGNALRERLQTLVQQDQSELILRQEFAEWLSVTLRRDPPFTAEDVFERLNDGSELCELLMTLSPGVTLKYHQRASNHFQKLANVETFLASCQKDFGIDNSELFDPQDLVEECGEPERRRIMTLFLAVAKTCHKTFKTVVPQIVKIDLEVDAEEEMESQRVTHDDIERMLAARREEEEAARLAAEEERRAEEERLRLEREAEALERERQCKAAEAERLRRLKQYEEEERVREEQRRLEEERLRAQREQERLRIEQERRRVAAQREAEERAERARLEAERLARAQAAKAKVEDDPVFQYKGDTYVACRRDNIDVKVSEVVNQMPAAASVRLFRIKEGMYVIEYPKRIVFFVRLCRDRVMIRVGGGWVTLTEFLSRRLRENPEKLPKFIPIQQHDGSDGITFLHRAANRYTAVV